MKIYETELASTGISVIPDFMKISHDSHTPHHGGLIILFPTKRKQAINLSDKHGIL